MCFSLCFFNHFHFYWHAMEIWRLALGDYKLWPLPEEENFVTWTYHLFQQSLGVGGYSLKPLCQTAVVFTQHRAWVWPVHPHHFKCIVPASIIQDKAWVWSVHSHHFKSILYAKIRTGPECNLSTSPLPMHCSCKHHTGQSLSMICPLPPLQTYSFCKHHKDRAWAQPVHPHHFKQHTAHGVCVCWHHV